MRAILEIVSRITYQLSARILLPEDSENIRIRKVVFLSTTFAGTIATFIWALILLAIDLNILAGFMAFVALSLTLNLLFVLSTNRFAVFVNLTLVITLLVPLIMQTM